jgi:hypothetical protein
VLVGLVSLGLTALLPGARAADFGSASPGDSNVTFTERSPLSTNQEICARMGWPLLAEEAAKGDYTLAQESFEVYVPPSYTGDKPFGLLVFVNPGGNGSMKNYERLGWKEIIDKHELIWVGPNKVGNDRLVRPRMGITIDAAINAQKRFKIDPARVYVAGASGGGRVASMLGVGFPDVFRGGFYIIGCNFYRQEPSVEQKGVFKRSYYVPPTKYYVAAKKQNKHVFLTGDTDGNREQTHIYYKGFVRDGFEHCTYLQVPGMGHSPPPKDWFAKGIAALDAPLPDPTTRPAAKPTAAVATTRKAPVTPATPATQPARTPAEDAQKLLAHAKLFVDSKQYSLAREKLRYIVAQYPATPGAKEAAKLLQEIAVK